MHCGGDDLLQCLVHQGCNRGHDQRHEDVAVVAVEDHGQTEDIDDVGRRAEQIDHSRVRVVGQFHEVRCEQRQHDRGRHPRVDVQLLTRVVGHRHRQEEEHGAPHCIHKLPARGLHLGAEVHKVERVEHRGERDDQRRTEKHAQDWAERIGEVFEERVQPRDLALGLVALLGFQVLVGHVAAGHLRQAVHRVVHAGHVATDDDLVMAAALRDRTHHLRVCFEAVLVGEGCVV